MLALVSLAASPGFMALTFTAPARAEKARIAVAANFTETAKALERAFAARHKHRVSFSFGSTGQLYAQIAQAAPFDAFLAADRVRPEMALDKGLAVAGSRFTYAIGRLALFGPNPGSVEGSKTLELGQFRKLAIANPATAPYGAAAVETMKKLGVYERLKPRLVRGTSIAQTFQFVVTGNAEIGFVALAQIVKRKDGARWIVPQSMHAPIAQDAVLLTRGKRNAAAKSFLDYLKTPEAQAIISGFGYDSGAPREGAR